MSRRKIGRKARRKKVSSDEKGTVTSRLLISETFFIDNEVSFPYISLVLLVK